MSDPVQVLFLCPGNSCRSQMADGIVNHDFSGKITAVSAGTEPHVLNPRAVQVMHEIGIDISRNSSDHLSRYEGQAFDYVTSLCGSNRTKSVNELVPKSARISSSGRRIQLALQHSLVSISVFPDCYSGTIDLPPPRWWLGRVGFLRSPEKERINQGIFDHQPPQQWGGFFCRNDTKRSY